MKRKELIKKIETKGCIFIRHGGRHDWYQNPRTKVSQPLPRHTEIKDHLANHILKILDDKSDA
ncbi:MAG: addiction module toxin, HicA family [Candidatus Schekmanbacteria bacterium RIFCSPLOWO2_12_FULL_38_15]|uniref:Addiction module toxin, HicA family n=1 Tax=Candidatus Schekmanbacteria bacterium RIFCSPLOWO2_12_FULL_38_15 TaxID=1817883 RepID=A0A1F7SGC6_9BACT|nr:MAG: addiction module toxin, HicA family [Candidatus Schekmanbacteria bacterium RIFCSPLOWO2_12_FULL_38_15]